MKLFSSKSRVFIAGLLAGTITATAVPVLAANEMVSVVVDNTIRLIIDGEQKTLPSDTKMLNLNGRTYLPSRFVAEELGATVTWNESARTINITSPEPEIVEKEVIVEKIVEKIVEVPVEKIVYVDRVVVPSLPTSKTENNISVNVQSILNVGAQDSANASTRVMLEVRNNMQQGDILVDYLNATLEVDDRTLRPGEGIALDVGNAFLNNKISAGNSIDGVFFFPRAGTGEKEFKLSVPIIDQMTGTVTVIEIEFRGTLS